MSNLNFTILILATLIITSSCATQNLFQGRGDENITELIQESYGYNHIIKPDDKISLSIWNHDDMSFGSVYSIYNSNEAFGKWLLVNDSGAVNLPKIGMTKIMGLTCDQATAMITSRYAHYLVKPIVAIKVLNKSISVLGEVRTPGSYTLDEERVTLIQGISFAQGTKEYSELSNIQLLRGDKKYSIDMTRNESMAHAIVLKDGDIINIPSKKGKRFHQNAPTIIPFTSIITALVLLSTILR